MNRKRVSEIISLEKLRKVRERVDNYGRLKMAQRLGYPYPGFSNKITGYNTIKQDEIDAINKILDTDK